MADASRGQQSGTGMGRGSAKDAKSWSGNATKNDTASNRPKYINERRPKVYFDISLRGKDLGRIVIELFGENAPCAAENFRMLCSGERGKNPAQGKMSFKGCKFFKMQPGAYICSGDIMKNDGTSGYSVYGSGW